MGKTSGILKDTTLIKCPWCSKISNILEWNALTFSKCTSRQMKREFTPLVNKKAFDSNKRSYYECPKCGQWACGENLKAFEESGKEICGLGGKPVTLVISERQ